VHQIDLLVGKQIIVSFVASIDPEGVSHPVQRSPRSPADRVHVSLWMAYVDRDELDAKRKTNDCDIDLASAAAHDLTFGASPRKSACKTAAPPVSHANRPRFAFGVSICLEADASAVAFDLWFDPYAVGLRMVGMQTKV
jgi:hypothetical protein